MMPSKPLKRFVLLTGILCLLISPSLADPAAKPATPPESSPKTVRLLTIGNSFSRNATKYLNELAEAGGYNLIHQPIYVGGASMKLHADKASLHDRSPEDRDGLYSDSSSLKQRLQQEQWDVVTIQQASILSHNPETYRPFAGQLRDYVQKHAPNARLMVHETWAYRADDPRFTKPSGRPGEPVTHVDMHEKLRDAYYGIAKELGTGVIPVGDAFHLASQDEAWGYRTDESFDAKTAEPPQLPNQRHSLHVGWRWQKNKDGTQRLAMDGHHANLAGEFLGSCVFYEVLFDADVTKNSFVPTALDPEFARFLKQMAHNAVAASRAN